MGNFFDKPALVALKLLPKEFMSRFIGKISGKKLPKIILVPWIRLYCDIYGADMRESKKSIPEFGTFNEFFTRELKPGVRKIDSSKNAIISPVDGTITEFGRIEKNILIQAKGKTYSLESLLENHELSKKFGNGSFITIYLAPENYHRIHAPVSGKISGYCYIPGSLFPVSNFSLRAIYGLFSRNERLITYIEHKKQMLAVVKIGACLVGKIRANYENISFDSSQKTKSEKKYVGKIPVKKGEEIGRFEIGSTVILLFEKSAVEFEGISRGMKIKMGEKIGVVL